jgi:hypothetical protein
MRQSTITETVYSYYSLTHGRMDSLTSIIAKPSNCLHELQNATGIKGTLVKPLQFFKSLSAKPKHLSIKRHHGFSKAVSLLNGATPLDAYNP